MSKVVDDRYLGTARTLAALAPFLKQKFKNPQAPIGDVENPVLRKEVKIAEFRRYLPYIDYVALKQKGREDHEQYCDYLQFRTALGMVTDFETCFDEYMRERGFEYIGQGVGLRVKNAKTLLEMWPMVLKNSASQEKFDLLLAPGHVGSERYVEWERA